MTAEEIKKQKIEFEEELKKFKDIVREIIKLKDDKIDSLKAQKKELQGQIDDLESKLNAAEKKRG